MKQYCRHCIHLCVNNFPYCAELKKEISYSASIHTNKCKEFEFCKIDAYGLTKGYKPRSSSKRKPKIKYESTDLF